MEKELLLPFMTECKSCGQPQGSAEFRNGLCARCDRQRMKDILLHGKIIADEPLK